MAAISIYVDDTVQKQAEAVCEELGMNLAVATNLFYKKLISYRGIPFELRVDPFYSEENQKHLESYVFDEGIAVGEKRGITVGEKKKLVSQVRKKVLRNQSAEEIADLLEEELSMIVNIYDMIKMHPQWDDDRICQNLEEAESIKQGEDGNNPDKDIASVKKS